MGGQRGLRWKDAQTDDMPNPLSHNEWQVEAAGEYGDSTFTVGRERLLFDDYYLTAIIGNEIKVQAEFNYSPDGDEDYYTQEEAEETHVYFQRADISIRVLGHFDDHEALDAREEAIRDVGASGYNYG